MLNIFYINLDEANERRIVLEECLNQFSSSDIQCHRISAYNKDYVEKNKIPGKIRSGEKGCFLSHKKAIQEALEYPGNALILEDDALLGMETINVLKNYLPAIQQKIDILYTDLCVSDVNSMLQLFKLRRSMLRDGLLEVLETKRIDFCGATAYILNNGSKQKLLNILDTYSSLDLPYDLVLKSLILQDQLDSGFIFPFITRLSPLSSKTQLQLDSDRLNNIAWDAFRKLMFFESKVPEDILRDLEQIPNNFYDAQAEVFSKILRLMLSENFKTDLY
ncbi:glycosyltransferase family 25 protein [Polynucleobacter alcilacus]|uniref:glycosyltransferase family 25 protein n=1 Tax=Polynucleobacter alcilacus TaxID=1819739 RepID=UPI001C0B41D6|nr:glycosyltransferase family 25 protein [Polynucleobacter alcilacus]MBU3568378.1 glycosyltransferase family 25 protein [Polynucleobacter alcilacus]